MSGGTESREPVDLLIEQFVQRRRAGSAVTAAAFAAEHPEHASELLEVLPALDALEAWKTARTSTGGVRAPAVPRLERLGDFRIVREIGRGGMGVVFEAVQESLDRRVALKVLPQASLLAGNQLERFRREARIAAQLHHTNIVPVFGSGESDGYHWYAMQFIDGAGLDRWRNEQQSSPPADRAEWVQRARFVARVGAQAASALHYAHGLGTLHRDVKPANLLLEHEDHLWVADFGLAKALESDGLTHSGDLLGTLQYMAPEQFAGVYDVRSEVYALGVTLWEMLALRPAFSGRSRSELMERIRAHQPESLRRLCPDAPSDLLVVVERAIARDPADRYADADALKRDLHAFLDDRPIAARRLSAAGQVWRWCRRNRALAALAASTLLAVVGAGVTGWIAFGAAAQESARAEANLRLALAGFGDVFDTLVGRDPTLALEEDPETGEQTLIVRTVVDPASVDLLRKMAGFYEQFAAQNAGNQALHVETARAYRRIGAIHARLGGADNLAAASRAYEQALERLRDVTDRDVSREIAAVYVDQGRLQQVRGDRVAAARCFLDALALLEQPTDGGSIAVRFERAQAHWLLAGLADPLQAGGGGGARPGPGAGDRGREVLQLQLRRTSLQHLQQAMELVAGLLAEEQDNREFRALQARCLLLASRLPGPRRTDPKADAARETQRQEGITILRDLVAKHPRSEQLRFQLVEALVDDGRGRAPGRRRRDDANGADRPAPSPRDLGPLREARQHADALVAEQPLAAEYHALLGRVADETSRALREHADAAADAEKAAMRQRAVAELETAVGAAAQALAAARRGDPRFVLPLVGARRSLASMYFTDRRRADGVRELQAIVELLEHHGVPLPAAPGPGGERDWFAALQRLLENAGQTELLARLQKLREK